MSTALSKVGALLVKGPLGALKEKMSPDTYGGTPLLGVKGAVIVGHGSSNETAVKNGIAVAAATVRAMCPRSSPSAWPPRPRRLPRPLVPRRRGSRRL